MSVVFKSIVPAALLCAAVLAEHAAGAQEASEPEDLEIEVEAEVPPPPPPPEPDAELLEAIARLEGRIRALETPPEPEPAPEPEPEPIVEPGPRWVRALDLRFSGYIQPQLQHHQLSEDEISPDGGPLNQDRFVVRRGRFRVERDWRYASTVLELDANTSDGPTVSLRRAEASLFLPNKLGDLPPYAKLTLGLTDIPFGYELVQGSRDRRFMERTLGSEALFPGEPDVGAKLSGALGPFRYAVAWMNGEPVQGVDDPPRPVFSAKKTWVGRVGVDLGKEDHHELAGGVSLLDGTGFHAGTPSTKSTLSWRDTNQDGLVTLSELVAAPGQAETPSSTFSRWAVGADAQLGLKSPSGWTRISAEAVMATNLDRKLYVADPISTGFDLRETAWSVAVVQDVATWTLAGLRAESYDGNADLFDSRRGEFLPLDASVLTLSPIAGAQIPELGRLVFQYDYVVDHLGRDTRGEPIDLPNDRWTLRLQLEL